MEVHENYNFYRHLAQTTFEHMKSETFQYYINSYVPLFPTDYDNYNYFIGILEDLIHYELGVDTDTLLSDIEFSDQYIEHTKRMTHYTTKLSNNKPVLDTLIENERHRKNEIIERTLLKLNQRVLECMASENYDYIPTNIYNIQLWKDTDGKRPQNRIIINAIDDSENSLAYIEDVKSKNDVDTIIESIATFDLPQIAEQIDMREVTPNLYGNELFDFRDVQTLSLNQVTKRLNAIKETIA